MRPSASPPAAPFLMQMAGWMGTGKSRLPAGVAEHTGAIRLDHDVTKSALMAAGLTPEHAGAGSYETLFAMAEDILSRGTSVIIDSPSLYSSVPERGAAIAGRHAADYVFVECSCNDTTIERRLRERSPLPSQVRSAADAASVRGDRRRRPHRPASGTITVDTERPPAVCVGQVLDALDRSRTRPFRRLARGDLVRLVSPASWPERSWLDESAEILRGWGLRVEIGPHAMDRHGFSAGRDADRLADLNAAFTDPEVRAVVATRGGAGAYRIADHIDLDAVRTDPKPLVGFSDITHLHLALWRGAGVPAVHGALAGDTARETVRRVLMSDEPLITAARADAVSAAVRASGRATGRLIGGNLTAVATSAGARLPDLRGAILFLEDLRHKGLGFVDRLLTQLIESGSLDDIEGVVLGSFEGFADVVDRGWTIVDVLQDRLGGLGVPVLGGVFAGHDLVGPDGGPDQTALPLGAMTTIDADAGTLACDLTGWSC